MISPDEDDWLLNDKRNTSFYMTHYFNMFKFWIFWEPMIIIIAVILSQPVSNKRMHHLVCISPTNKRDDWRNTAHTVLAQVEMHNPFLAVLAEWMDGKRRHEG